MGKYALSLSYIDEDFLMQCEGVYLEKANQVGGRTAGSQADFLVHCTSVNQVILF